MWRYIREAVMPKTAKIFQSGNSQAVRLPKEFCFDVKEVEISREGDAVILRPKPDATRRWARCMRRSNGGLAWILWPRGVNSRRLNRALIWNRRARYFLAPRSEEHTCELQQLMRI